MTHLEAPFFSLQTQEVEKDRNGESSSLRTDMVSVATQTKTGKHSGG